MTDLEIPVEMLRQELIPGTNIILGRLSPKPMYLDEYLDAADRLEMLIWGER